MDLTDRVHKDKALDWSDVLYQWDGKQVAIPIEVLEAARIDGAGRFAIFWRIFLPLTTPGLIATFLLAFSFSWNDFVFAIMLTQTKATTLPIAIAQQQGQLGTSWWDICAISLISMIPMIAAAIVLQKRLVTGLLGGSER